MVIPYKHTSDFTKLSPQESCDMMSMLNKTITMCQKILSPHGFNVGMNLGASAGAGIEEHIHLHLVPRWHGDANFMPVIASTKVIPQSLAQLYKLFTKEIVNAKI